MTDLSLPPLGIMNQMWAAASVSDEEAIATALEEIRIAEDLGFDSLWIGEHHGTRPGAPFHGRIPAPDLMLAYIAASTRRMKVGSGVRILSSASPLRTVEEMPLMHLLTNGRVEYGIGLGSFQPNMTESRAEKAARFQIAMDELLSLLKSGKLDETVDICPKPAPAIVSKIWAAARDAETIRYLARRRINLVFGQAELGIKQADYVRCYREAGGQAGTRGVRLVFVADTHDEAIAGSEVAAKTYFAMMGNKGYHKEAVDEGLLPPTVDSPEELRRQVSFIVGDPTEVAADLNDYAATTGVDRLDVMVQIPGLETSAIRRSMALIQHEVRPRLRLRSQDGKERTAA